MSLDRGRVWQLLGAPTDQEGSVNDPRTRVEHGVRFNEKWIYRGEDGESVLDTSHLREYTDLDRVRELVANADLRIFAMKRSRMWFPLLDPVLFRVGHRLRPHPRLLHALRATKVPIPGYYLLELVVER